MKGEPNEMRISAPPGGKPIVSGRIPAWLAACAMIICLGLVSRLTSHRSPCESRSDVEQRVSRLGEQMQSLAAAHILSTQQLGHAIQDVNAADVRFGPSQAYQQHCVALDAVASSLPAAAN